MAQGRSGGGDRSARATDPGTTARRRRDALLAIDLDVTDADQATRAGQSAVDTFGRIDVLVNNVGRGLLGAVEESSAAVVRAVYEVNVFGTLTVQRPCCR
uniref:SDR family NAD(P)-dependent oxidoreductase n=1 Tax=Mycobacterium tilburgii TaxID=44467 RepID=UPI003898E634